MTLRQDDMSPDVTPSMEEPESRPLDRVDTQSLPRYLWWTFLGSCLVLFICSSLRHNLFQSTALDLGYFDQTLYLLSSNQPPIVSFFGQGYHFMGGHADWILYIISGLYRIYPTVYWLFGIQAIALSIGCIPVWLLARQAGLPGSVANGLTWTYLLYPVVFNLNLFDFHPEVIALPLTLITIWAARKGNLWLFGVATLFILGCRASLSLMVAAMGVWLLAFERRYWAGAIALFSGIGWFGIVTYVIVPRFKPDGYHALSRYAELGDSIPEAALNLVLKPNIVLGKLFTFDNLWYLVLLLIPVIWGLSLRYLAPLFSAAPILLLNLLSTTGTQKDLIHQYSLPMLPFFMVAIIAALAAKKTWFSQRRVIILWALVSFVALAKPGYFTGRYLKHIDNWAETREAVDLVTTKGNVLTTQKMAPHLTHRPILHLLGGVGVNSGLSQYEYVLVNLQHFDLADNWRSQPNLIDQATDAEQFEQLYGKNQVYLFRNQAYKVRSETDSVGLSDRFHLYPI